MEGMEIRPPTQEDEPEWRRQIAWLSACGINTIEFATMFEFNRIPSTELSQTDRN